MSQVDLPILDDLQVATPCPARWDDMTGDAHSRFCAGCRKTVYDLTGLTRAEALALVTRPGEAPCVRFYRRGDGTILTADCPVGLRTRVNRWRRQAVAATLALVTGAGLAAALRRATAGDDSAPTLVGQWVSDWVDDSLVFLGLRPRLTVEQGDVYDTSLTPPSGGGSLTMGEAAAVLSKPAPMPLPTSSTCPPSLKP